MIPGVKFNLNGEIYVVPPLNQGGMRRTSKARQEYARLSIEAVKKIKAAEAEGELPDVATLLGGDEEYMQSVALIAWEALRRNYPALTLEDMDELLEGGVMAAELVNAAMGVVPRSQREVAEGEPAPQPASTKSLTGATSTD